MKKLLTIAVLTFGISALFAQAQPWQQSCNCPSGERWNIPTLRVKSHKARVHNQSQPKIAIGVTIITGADTTKKAAQVNAQHEPDNSIGNPIHYEMSPRDLIWGVIAIIALMLCWKGLPPLIKKCEEYAQIAGLAKVFRINGGTFEKTDKVTKFSVNTPVDNTVRLVQKIPVQPLAP